jgi:hypothetical protein
MESDVWPRSRLHCRVHIKPNDGSTVHGSGDICQGSSVSFAKCSVGFPQLMDTAIAMMELNNVE